MTFPWQFATLLPILSVTDIMPVLVLLSVVGIGMQQCMIRNQNGPNSAIRYDTIVCI